MGSPSRAAVRATAAVLALGSAVAPLAASADGSLAAVNAAARSAGNRKPVAVAVGRALFARTWPAQITKVRVDGVGTHAVAGIVLSGTRFHGALDARGFAVEALEAARVAFAAAPLEEVDLWATVPIPVAAHTVVSGDYAMPTAKTVFALAVRRTELAGLARRLRSGDGIFWDDAWRRGLETAT